MAKRGRKRKFETPSDLEAAVDGYFRHCEDNEEFPDEKGMLIWLGLGLTAYAKYKGEYSYENGEKSPFYEDEQKRYREIFEDAAMRRESWLARRMAKDGKGANGYMNLLKQKANGGYKDRPTEEENKGITINLVGVGGEGNFK